MALKTELRATEMLHLLLSRGKTSVEEMAEVFGTSAASVRRDLARLEERGLVHRTHGGAMLAGQTYEPFRLDASFHVREDRFAAEKARIAAAATNLIGERETIGFTAGTTTMAVARTLRLHGGVRVVTNAVNIAVELSAVEGLETTLTGGSLRWPGASSLIGPAALETLNSVVLDKLFLGVCGIDPVHGATTIEPEEAAVFRAMARRAKQVIVVADSSKLGLASPAVICPVAQIDVLITDDAIAEEAVRSFGKVQIEVLVA